MRQAGWYLRQFINFEAAWAAEPQDLVLIWDADTIPLRRLSFMDNAERILLYPGAPIAKPYLAMARALFDVHLVPDRGFSAQHFACHTKTVEDFCSAIEARHGAHWIDTVLNLVNKSPNMAFSEYECLGLFMHAQNPKGWRRNRRTWERFGVSLAGPPERLDEAREAFLSRFFDFISFEAWDQGEKYAKRKIANQVDNWKKVLIRARINRLP